MGASISSSHSFIIHKPLALAVKITNQPVAVDQEVIVRPMLPLSLTVDFRVVDRGVAVEAMNDLKQLIEHPNHLFYQG
ncbi:MAG: 2-oxo acid dehydrogenase subunit E2 [Aerococcus sp.]|nr:2-oxo acid dehydrogenase subunit E2 [Aerococcus sp.]